MRGVDRKIVIVTRPTRLEGVIAQHATPQQALFRVQHNLLLAAAREPRRRGKSVREVAKEDQAIQLKARESFKELSEEAEEYSSTVNDLRAELADFAPVHVLDRKYLPNYVFGPEDVVITVGQDGLVANTAKYALGRPIVAVNPDPEHIDGILLPFRADQARSAVQRCLRHDAPVRHVTLAEVTLIDGQRLLAFNDFFIGAKSHVSARYSIEFAGRKEQQSSSGVIVSTGAGTTGWLSSILNMSAATLRLTRHTNLSGDPLRLAWDDPRLVFVTREPFLSKMSGINVTSGILEPGQELTLESNMSREGVIFSDGIEADFLEFNSGAIARIRAAKDRATLVTAT